MRHQIRFETWEDYRKGLDIATDAGGEVVCRPRWSLIVTTEQKKALDDNKIPYINGE